MASRPKYKMSTLDRAKQFAPFSALKGLERAMAEKEKEIETRRVLSDEAKEELGETLAALVPGQEITVRYYDGERYQTVTGKTVRADGEKRLLAVEEKIIYFDDIYTIVTESSLPI